MDGVSVSSLERTARWVQTHAVRQHGDPQPHSGSRSRGTARRHAHGHDSSPHSSRTDITPPSRTPTTTVRYNVAPAQAQAIRIAYAHSSKKGGGEHQQRRSRGRSQPPTPIERPVNPISRLHIPTELYHSPNLPAFVQGPPGSGYPMTMTPIRTPDRERVVFPTGSPPSPPPKIPSQLNPKVRHIFRSPCSC